MTSCESGRTRYRVPGWLQTHLPDWDTGEIAVVATAAFTAFAALAAWLSARASLVLQRSARVPHVSGAVTRDQTTGQIGLTFANAGPVLAVQVLYLLVGDTLKHGGAVSDGHLAVGEKWRAKLPAAWASEANTRLVWGWRDLDDNVFFRNDNWDTKRISRRRYLRRKQTNLGDMFSEMYPKVPIP